MANLTHTDTAWSSTSPVVTPSATKQQTVTLGTAGKYVDKDIKILVDKVSLDTAIDVTGDAELYLTNTEGSATISSVSVEGASGSYRVTGSADITGIVEAGTSVSGYASSGNTLAFGDITGTANVEAYIPAASMTVTGSATVKPNNVTAANGNAKVVSTSTTTSAPTDGSFYIGVTPSTAASTNITQTKTGYTEGYLGGEGAISTGGTVSGGNGTKRYVKIQSGSLSNAATTGVTYSENTADNTVIPANGSLYLDEGYYPATKITLAHIIPDPESGKANAGAAQMRSGYVAYDGDGNKIVGTMADVSLSHSVSATGSASGVTLGTAADSAPASGAYITVTGSDSVNTTGTGYIAKLGTDATKSATKYYPVSITDAQAPSLVGSATVSGTGSKAATKPTIAEGSANSTNTQIISSTPSTTAPSSDYYYVSVKATAPATTGISVKQTSATKGFANIAANTQIGTASTSQTTGDVYYAPVKKGTITKDTTGGTSTDTITAGKQIKISAGYYPSDVYYTAQSASDTAAGTITATGSASSVTVTGASIGAYNASTKTVDVTTTNTVAGTATGTGATAGYITTSTTSGAKSFTTTGKTATFSMNAYDGAYTVS